MTLKKVLETTVSARGVPLRGPTLRARSDEKAIQNAAGKIGNWDVLIMGAGHEPSPAKIVDQKLVDFWTAYEVNVKSIVIAAQALFPHANENASVFAITSGAMALPPAYTPNLSGSMGSKVAQIKLMEFLAAENPDKFICSVHPGIHDTKMFRRSAADASQLPMDTLELHAHFMVWLATPKNKFLQGRVVFANWDVDELSARAEEITTSTVLTIGYSGWPFA
ncbi:putative Uncharacterized oxidoreductase C30D10.05c [Glarea lozoyensis 74030]|uniref:Putative Uncharacterized oxidoreductase C30D10.05c n=1 Tax=Glarea lozoyensis (strain ATCC 74030 / MF5533) TaxID=1104152 RepID=H0EF39_GLAL7|nr:putative Uncharacterized oxidoreductase C30D10.05c [Glarea lozoyensis 74030]